MENLTNTQIENAALIFVNSLEEMTKGINGCAKVAKAISLAINIDFSNACKLMDKLSQSYSNAQNILLSL